MVPINLFPQERSNLLYKYFHVCISLLQALKLSKSSLGQTTVGQIVNLMSNDVDRFDYFMIFMHYLWVGPVMTVVITYFLWLEIGVSAFYGVAALLVFIPTQSMNSFLFSHMYTIFHFIYFRSGQTKDCIAIVTFQLWKIKYINYKWNKRICN